LQQFSKYLKKDFVFISCDEISLLNFTSAKDFLNYFVFTKNIDFKAVKYLLLDEIQAVNNISLFLKDLHDNFNFKIFASGSGSLQIFKGISDSLIGRKEIIRIYPFSLAEFLLAKKISLPSLKNFTPVLTDFYLPFLEEFLLYGGYPEVVIALSKKRKIKNLLSIYKSYLEKDIKEYINNKDIFSFQKIYKLISSSLCSLQKIDSLSRETGVHHSKIKEFNFILKNTFTVDFLQPLVKNPLKEIKSHKKIYFSDLGFINSSWESFVISTEKKGKLLENFVLQELKKSQMKNDLLDLRKIYFWRKKNQTEIDFVIKNLENDQLIPIEVKSKDTDIIPKSFQSFYKAYAKDIDFFVVFNKSVKKIRKLEDKKVLFMPYIYAGELFSKQIFN